jgi:hypothetical protein
MWFRLDNGTVVELTAANAALSEFFNIIQTSINLSDLILPCLAQSEHADVATEVVRILNRVGLTDIAHMNPEVRHHFVTVSLPEHKALDSVEPHLRSNVLTACLYVGDNVDKLLSAVIHRLPFLSDACLLSVLEFLTIACTKRSDTMFDDLPGLCRQSDQQLADIKGVDVVFHAYIAFIEKQSEKSIIELARAASLLNIKPLIVLVGCRLSRMILNVDEQRFRKVFQIPNKFRHSASEKLKELTASNDAWFDLVT